MNKIFSLLFIILFVSSCSISSQKEDNTEKKSGTLETKISTENSNILQPEKELVLHQSMPEKVKSLYFPAAAFLNQTKKANLESLVENKEINSITLDIKTISGYTNFDFPEEDFSVISPVSNSRIKNIKEELKQLHEKWIYVIGRVVVFKDARLAESRPDLAVKWEGTEKIWTDYKGKKYLDPAAKELITYYQELSVSAYDLWFDEINFDYIRFPSDGRISQAAYPHAWEIIVQNPKWGKIMTIDRFAHGVTKAIKSKRPNLKISADVFGLVTNTNGYQIGQNLESFLLYFDAVGPMIYPSHYGKGYLWYQVPDNAPYAIFNDSMKRSKPRIDTMNQEILQATASGTLYQVSDVFSPAFDIADFEEIKYTKMRPWLQGFSCSRCKGATGYTRTKFREQIRGMEENGLDSWWVWSAWGNYYPEWYDAK